MSTKSRNKGLKALATQFAAVTGSTEEIGLKLLNVCNGNLEMAIGMQLEGGIDAVQASGSDGASSSAAAVPINDDDNVRAPIPQKQEVLVPDVPAFGPRPRTRRGRNSNSVFDKFRDFEAETRQQEEMIRRGAAGRSLAGRKKTLEDLFRPPIDIMHKGTLNTAREYGQAKCRWVIVNVQNVQEFSCQQLNRDVWSDSTVKSIIKESFVFWQVYHDSDEGQRFMQYYKVLEFPYVAVLDPRTGEQMASWTRLDNMSFCDLAMQFLSDHPMFDQDGISPPAKRLKTQRSIIDASEDSQLEAAIAASLAEPSSSNSNTEPAIPATASSIPSAKRKIISIPEDDDSDTFHSVNGSSSEADSEDENNDSVHVLDNVKNNVSNTNKAKLQERTQGCSKSTESGQKQDNVQKQLPKLAKTERTDQGDEETGERTSKNSLVEKNNQRSDMKEVLDGSEAAKPGTSCQQNGAAKPDERDSGAAEEESEVASEADTIDPSNACNLMLRFPNGKRKQVTLQATDPLLKLVKLVNKEGFPNERYELVTNFPRRRLSYLDINTNLKAAGLFPQETIFVQER